MNKRKTGEEYEAAAAEYLAGNGFCILERNYRCRYGEIDLIGREGRYLVFTEVKYRKDSRFGEGEYAVDFRKQRRISYTARWYLMEHHLDDQTPCRFDVLAIEGARFHLIRDAFP